MLGRFPEPYHHLSSSFTGFVQPVRSLTFFSIATKKLISLHGIGSDQAACRALGSKLCEGSFFKAHLLEMIETGNEWNEWKLKQKAMKLQQSGPILERYAVPRRETSRLLHHTKHRYFQIFSISSMNSVVFHGIFMAFPFFY